MSTPLRVLIVEDSEDDMALLVGELRRGGYELTFERVDTGAGMTAALDKNQWDLVIRDYSMPHTELLTISTTLSASFSGGRNWDTTMCPTIGQSARTSG